MPDTLYARAKSIFLEALEQEASAREGFIERACQGEADLRREVEALLEHHDPKSIVGKRAEVAQEHPAKGRALRPRGRSSSGTENRPVYARARFWVLVAFALLLGLGLWSRQRVERSQLQIRAEELQVILNANVAALDRWVEEQKIKARQFAQDPRIVPHVGELLEIAEGGEGVAEALKGAPARDALLGLWKPIGSQFAHSGAGIVNVRGMDIFDEAEATTGVFMSPLAMSLNARVLAGETVFTRPLRSSEVIRESTPFETGSMYTFVGAPVRDAADRAIAVFWVPFAAYGPFSDILETAQIGQTGETYAFDDRGLMLSRSRFTEELRDLGLLPPEDNPERAWDRSTQLNLSVRDPGVDLREADLETLDLDTRPLTKLAATVIASRRKADPAAHQGVLSEPYRGYRGVEVIGAWRWHEEYDLALATEMEVDEALGPLHYLDAVFAVLFGLLTIFVGATLVSSSSALRMRRRMENLRQLGEYSLGELIAQGGMGKVYRAEHALLKRPAAVKVISEEQITEEGLVRFEREVQATSRLRNPHVVEVYDFGRASDGTFYYAMEFLPGLNLTELVKRDGALPPARVVHILRQVCSALREAHGEGLVHRDIKPGNIMVCNLGGENDFVKVLDFGLVKSVSRDETDDLTGATQVGGTLLYMAPERIRAPRELDTRSDIYSLGAVGYYLLSGRPLFDSDDSLALVHRILNEDPAPLSEGSAQTVPAVLDELVARCIAKDPEGRPQSVQEVAEGLDSLDESRAWRPEDRGPQREQAPVPLESPSSTGREKPDGVAAPGILARPAVRVAVALLALGLVAGAGAVWNALFSGPGLTTVAVVPFQYDGPESDQDFLAPGLTEDVITQLSKIESLDVIARASMMEYEDTRKGIDEIAEELGAGSVVSGSVRRVGERLRITASLVDARDHQNLWTESYDREFSELLDIQIEVARQIAAALDATLSPADLDRLQVRPAASAEAYELYLHGRTTRNVVESQASLLQAKAYFRSALEKDPGLALAYAGLAEIDFLLGCSRYLAVDEVRPRMTDSVLKALETGNDVPETHVSRGLLAYYDWDWATAEASFQRAVELNPRHWNARRERALLLARTGRFDEAVDEMQEVLRMDPLSGLLRLQLGRFELYRGRPVEALEQLERFSAKQQDVAALFAVWDLTGALVGAGRSVEDVEAAIGPDDGAPPRLASLAYAHAAAGRRDTALELAERYASLEPSTERLRTWEAAIRVALGENETALALLEEAFEDHECTLLPLRVDPRYEPLRDHPRFEALLRRMGHDL